MANKNCCLFRDETTGAWVGKVPVGQLMEQVQQLQSDEEQQLSPSAV
jgi:hypothetical protein